MRETKLMQLRNKSVFAPYFTDFIEQKRALGNRYDTCVETLNLFDDFCMNQGVTEPKITPDLFQKWCKRRPNENQTTQVIRINHLQIFSRYMHNNGYEAPCAFHPLPGRSKEFRPYIFTEKEIADFIATVDKMHIVPVRGTPIRHLVYPVLFRALCGCGLRINEALQLKTEDVNLENGTFLIRNAKGGKDRMVVLSDSLLAICRNYHANPLIQEYSHEYFFPTKDHGFYDASTIYADFRKYLQLSGINHRGRGYGPRLHDFRHTFAVQVIQKWQTEGRDIYLCLPILQSYLGHARLTATEKYLRLVHRLPFRVKRNSDIYFRRCGMKQNDDFAYYLSKFFQSYLSGIRNMSVNTIHSYRDTFTKLLVFYRDNYGITPEKMSFSVFTREQIENFLFSLENEQKCSISTRNQRLAAIKSFCRYV